MNPKRSHTDLLLTWPTAQAASATDFTPRRFSTLVTALAKAFRVPALMSTLLTVATAADHTSTWNSTNGNWNDTTKWTTPTAPGTFPNNGTTTYDAIQNGGSITRNVAVTLEKLTLNGGQQLGTNTVTLNDLFTFNAGQLDVNGQTNANGGVTLSTTNDKFLGSNAVLNLNSNTSWIAGRIRLYGATVNNAATRTLTMSFDGELQHNAGTNTFNNAGIFTKSGGTGTGTVSVVTNNTGTINANSGTLSFTGGGTSAGTWNVAGGATLNFGAGTHNLTSGSVVTGTGTGIVSFSGGTTNVNAGSTYVVAGTTVISGGIASFGTSATTNGLILSGGDVAGSGTLTVNGTLDFIARAMDGTGVTNANGGTTISTASDKFLGTGRTLNFNSDTSWTGGKIRFWGGTINNTAGKTFTNTFDGAMQLDTGTNAFNNAGIFTKSGGTGTTTIAVPMNNTGTINANSGTLSFTGGGTSTGTWNVAGGASLNFGAGAHALNSGTSFTGAGTVQLAGATWNRNAAVAVDEATTFHMSSGSILGTGSLTLNGPMLFTGGAIDSAAPVNAEGGATLSTTNDKFLGSNAVLNLNSNTSWSAGRIRLYGATVNNAASRTLTMSFDGELQHNAGTNTFNNAGIFTKSGGTGTGTVSVVTNNTGTINANSGTLSFTAGGTSTGAWNVAGGATLNFGAGTYNLNSGSVVTGTGTGVVNVSGGTAAFNAGTTYTVAGTTLASGSGIATFNTAASTGALTILPGANVNGSGVVTVSGLFTFSGGGLTGSGSPHLNANGPVAIDTTNQKFFGGRVLNLNNSTTWSGGTIRFSGGTVNNGSGMTFTNSFDGTMQNDSGTNAFNNAGIFTKSGGTGTTTIAIPINNTGMINANSGTLSFTSSYTQTAGALVLDGGQVTGGTLAVRGGKLQGRGTITGGVSSTGGTVIIEPGIGTTPGTLVITGDLTLTNSSKLSFDIGGITPGTQHDQITEAGSGALNVSGVTLEFGLPTLFLPTASDVFVLVDSNTTISGSFANVANGARLDTQDGKGSFKVSYGASSGFADKTQIILSDFIVYAPTALSSNGLLVAENAPLGTAAGSFQVVDATPVTIHTYSLVPGPGDSSNGLFQIVGNTLLVLGALDYETSTSHSIRVRVTNAQGRFFEQAFVVAVQDQGPTSVSLGVSSILEGRPIGTAISTFSSTVLPLATAITSYQLVSGVGSTDNSLFSIDGATLKTATVLNHESADIRSIRVRATDAHGETLEQSFVITVANVTISNISLSSDSVLENLPAATDIATLSMQVTPADPGAVPVFTILSATPGDAVTLINNQLRTTRTLLRPVEPTLSLRLRVVHLGESLEKNVVIQVNANAPQISLEHPAGSALIDGESAIPFGGVVMGTSVSRVVTVHNGGNANLTGLTIEITGTDAASFTVTSPATAPVLPGESTSFTLQFAPTSDGPKNAVLQLVSNDYDEGIFDLSLNGTGLTPEINVSGAGQLISPGDTTPNLEDRTDFGRVPLLDAQATSTFTLQNPGTSTLHLEGTPIIEISGPHAADFKVTTSPPSELTAGNSSAFSITFDPQLPGPRTALVSIASDDPLTPHFTFTIAGFGALAKALPQTIAFNAPSAVYLDEGSVTLEPYATSGLPVTLSVLSGPATLTGNVLTPTNVGTVHILASQPGGGNYAPARSVKRTLKIKPSPAELTLIRLSQRYTGTPRAVSVLGASQPPVILYKVGGTLVPDPPISAGRYHVQAQAGGKTKTGTLIITPAPLYVTPDDKRKFAGQANPSLTFQISGLVSGDTSAALTQLPLLTTNATAKSPGGTYPILSTKGAAPNYTLIRQQGTLVVESFTGLYEILLLDNSQVPSGKLILNVAKSSQSFTGRLLSVTETNPLSLSGRLVTDPLSEQATGSLTQIKNGVAYSADFTLPLYGPFSASATRDASPLGASPSGHKMPILSKKQSVSYSGLHTALLEPATPTGSDVPAGAGWASANINRRGQLTLAGRLGDGTIFTTSLPTDRLPDPGYRLFLQPYKPARTHALLAGTFSLSPHPALNTRRWLENAALHWIKAPRDADSAYRTGFTTTTHLLMNPWIAPKAPDNLALRLGLAGNSFAVSHSPTGSASDSLLPVSAILDAKNRISIATLPNTTLWKTSVNLAKGTFVTSFQLQDGTNKRTVTATGALRQPADIADLLIGNGHFLLSPLPGAPSNEKRSGELIFQRPAP